MKWYVDFNTNTCQPSNLLNAPFLNHESCEQARTKSINQRHASTLPGHQGTTAVRFCPANDIQQPLHPPGRSIVVAKQNVYPGLAGQGASLLS